jgi:hypothetical protein
MAFDELISPQAALLQSLLANAWARWSSAANRARTSTYTIDDLFEDLRQQFVSNWDTWNDVMGLPTLTQLPTVTIQGQYSNLTGLTGEARVSQRLTYATYLTPPLEQVGGANTVPFAAAKTGLFDGSVQVTLAGNAALPAPGPDVYRGVVLGDPQGGTSWEPLAWVVVVATV